MAHITITVAVPLSVIISFLYDYASQVIWELIPISLCLFHSQIERIDCLLRFIVNMSKASNNYASRIQSTYATRVFMGYEKCSLIGCSWDMESSIILHYELNLVAFLLT